MGTQMGKTQNEEALRTANMRSKPERDHIGIKLLATHEQNVGK
jgi:hypothetical protein